jgi:SAM-dependent methyltransferase
MIYELMPHRFKKVYKKFYIKTFYDLLTFYKFKNKVGDLRFMNYGYATEDDKNLPLTVDFIHKLQSGLYLFMLNHITLDEKDIIEIGCGRGGGCSLIREKFKAARVVGTDISSGNIKKCKSRYKSHDIEFLRGDAEKQQFPDNSFDIVLNVESSHCYPSKKDFLSNVSSILRPGGYFLYADIFRSESNIIETENMLHDSGFIFDNKEDITSNIIFSLELFAGKRDEMLKMSVLLRWFRIHEKFAASDSSNFSKFKSGEKKYFFYLLRK